MKASAFLSLLFFAASIAHAGIVNRDYLVSRGINPRAAGNALDSYDRLQNSLEKKRYITIVDFTKAAYEKRMYLVDMESGAIEIYHVTHGVNSGANWVLRTSNELAKDNKDIGSLRSASGNFKTLSTKQSERAGFSLTMAGLDDDNKNTFDRYIYIHGAPGVNPDWMKDHDGIFKRSEGCFVVDRPLREHVIELLKGGTLLYAYWDEKETLEHYLASPEGQNGNIEALFKGDGIWQPGENPGVGP